MMDEMRTTLIPSPFGQGDIVDYEGNRYQVIEFVGCSTEGLVYRGRSTVDNAVVVDIVLPVVGKNHHQLSSVEGEEGYFQIMELSEDDVANLKSWSGGGEEKKMKMKVRWGEDVEKIRDGLTKEDKEVFCTVGKAVGKEVLGNIKVLSKDPPIIKMPDLIMDMILYNLTPEDRLQCRLVTPEWAFELFPINRFTTCHSLSLDHDGGIFAHFMPNQRSRCAKHMCYDGDELVSLRDLEPLIKNSLLENINLLYIEVKSRPEDDLQLQLILDRCHNIADFEFSGEVDQPESVDAYWTWAKKFISTNSKQLESLTINADIRELSFSDDLHVGDCTSLESLKIVLSRKNSILRNLESLPCCITSLEIRDLSVPLTKPQMLWIATHLHQLTCVELAVLHHHFFDFDLFALLRRNRDQDADMDNELDENTMVEMMNRLPRLRHMEFTLTTGHGSDRLCNKAKRLKSRLDQRQYHKKGWGITLDLSSKGGPYQEEVLTVSVVF